MEKSQRTVNSVGLMLKWMIAILLGIMVGCVVGMVQP